MVYLRLTLGIGFVWYFFQFVRFGAEGAEALEVLDGAAVLALGLGLVAQKEFPGVGLLSVHVEAGREREIAILGAGDFDIAIAGHLGGHETELLALRAERSVEATGQHTGLEAGDAEEGHLAEGDALDGEDFLGVDGAVGVEGVLRR